MLQVNDAELASVLVRVRIIHSKMKSQASPVELMHSQQGIDMIGVLLQQSHDGVGIKAGLALLK